MSEEIIDLGQGFWTIRGNLRIAGVLNVGTQAALVQRPDGRFVMIDSYSLTGAVRDRVMALTDGGRAIDAVLNVHPFHTLHCTALAADLPDANFYGSKRHWTKLPGVKWQDEAVESAAVAQMFPELRFSLPDGVDYICENDKVHAGSLLVYHPASRTVHVDDTFNVLPLPGLVRKVFNLPRISLHPQTRQALEKRPNAGGDFCDWAEGIARDWGDTRHLCAAHSALARFDEGGFSKALRRTIAGQRPKLEAA